MITNYTNLTGGKYEAELRARAEHGMFRASYTHIPKSNRNSHLNGWLLCFYVIRQIAA